MTIKTLKLSILGALSIFAAGPSAAEYTMRTPLVTEISKWVSVDIDYGDWVLKGSKHSCTEWLPVTDQYFLNNPFTQKRTCYQDQERTVVKTEWDNFSETGRVHTYPNEIKKVPLEESREAIGTKVGYIDYESTFTEWVDYNSSYSEYLPSPGVQTSSYSQSRTLYTYQERYEQKRRIHNVTGQIINVGDPIRRLNVIETPESRTIHVSATSFVNLGGIHSCGGWSPAPDRNTKRLSQSQTCKQNQVRTLTHTADSSHLYTYNQQRTINHNNGRTVQAYWCSGHRGPYEIKPHWSGCTAR